MRHSLRRILAAAICCLAAVFQVYASDASPFHFDNESIRYKVMFKWGLINKTAGYATINLNGDGPDYRATVYARSEPWADRIYSLRDTLSTVMNKVTVTPLYYERIAHENGKYVCDRVTFTRLENRFTAECRRVTRDKSTQQPVEEVRSLEAEGVTVDFLSAFYYLRTLDFKSMSPGRDVTVNIFSGKRKELLKFTYMGEEKLRINNRDERVFRVMFTFTTEGKKKSGDPITAWLTADGKHTPLMIEGKLPVGKIRAIIDR